MVSFPPNLLQKFVNLSYCENLSLTSTEVLPVPLLYTVSNVLAFGTDF